MKRTYLISIFIIISLAGSSQQYFKLGKKISESERTKLIDINKIRCILNYNIVIQDTTYGFILSPSEIFLNRRIANKFIKTIKNEYKITAPETYLDPNNKDVYIIKQHINQIDYTLCYERRKNNTYKVFLCIRYNIKTHQLKKLISFLSYKNNLHINS